MRIITISTKNVKLKKKLAITKYLFLSVINKIIDFTTWENPTLTKASRLCTIKDAINKAPDSIQ